MSEINANFVVSPYDVNITLESPTVEVVAEPINLNLSLGGFTPAGGNINSLQYNTGNGLGGIPYANYANGNLNLGNNATLKILGGANAYFLQTDGTGNLVWAQGTANITGNGTAAGANTQIQISDGTGNFTSAAGFTFDNVSNVFNSPGNGIFVGNVAANTFIGNFSGNYTGTNLNITGNGIFTENVTANNFVGNFAGNFVGNLNQITNGNSNVVVAANGNITISSNGVANAVVITSNSIIGNKINVNDIILNNNVIKLGSNIGTLTTTGIILGADVGNYALGYPIIIGAGALAQATAGNGNPPFGPIAIGIDALQQGGRAGPIAIGGQAGGGLAGNHSISIGTLAGAGIGEFSIAIGYEAGASSNVLVFQPNNSIILNATGDNLQANTSNTFYVKPIRNANTGNVLFYDQSTGEITYSTFTGNANVANTVSNNAQPNITSVGTLTSLAVTGNISGGNANLGNLVIGNYLTGTLTTNAQPNITSVGNLSNLVVTGNVNANYFIGNGSQLTGITGFTSIVNGTSNITIPVANGNINFSSNGVANVFVITNANVNHNGPYFNAVNVLATGCVFATLNITSSANVVGEFVKPSTQDYLTATGNSQGTANSINVQYQIVSFANSGTGVILPAPTGPTEGTMVTIMNRAGNDVLVYPSSGTQINGGGINTAYTLPNVATVSSKTFIYMGNTNWYTL